MQAVETKVSYSKVEELEPKNAAKLTNEVGNEFFKKKNRNFNKIINGLGRLQSFGLLSDESARPLLTLISQDNELMNYLLSQNIGENFKKRKFKEALVGLDVAGLLNSSFLQEIKSILDTSLKQELSVALTLRLHANYMAGNPHAVLNDITLFEELQIQPLGDVGKILLELKKRAEQVVLYRQQKVKELLAQRAQKQAEERVEPKKSGIGRRRFLKTAGIALAAGSVLTSAPAPTPSPEPTLTPTTIRPEVTPIPEVRQFADLLKPLIDQAMRKRAERAKQDPEYARRVDQDLNKDKLNFLIIGIGKEKGFELSDSIMLASYSVSENKVRLISFPRDIHAPEVDRYLQSKGEKDAQFNAINTAYSAGGFELTRKVLEDATSLSVDYIGKFKIEGFMDFVSQVLGEVEIDIKEDFIVPPAYGSSVGIDIRKGIQKLDANTLQEYARSRLTTGDISRAGRQQEVVNAIAQNLKNRFMSVGLIQKGELFFKTLGVLKGLQDTRKIEFDSDVPGIYLKNVIGMMTNVGSFFSKQENQTPEITRKVFGFDSGMTYERRASSIRPHILTIQEGDF